MIMLFILICCTICCTNTKFNLKEKGDKGEQMQSLHQEELDLPPPYEESVSVEAAPSAPPLPRAPQLDVSDVSKKEDAGKEVADRGVVERNFTINTVLHKAIDARDIKSIKKMWNKQASEIKLSEQDKIEASCLVAGLGYEDIFCVLGEEKNELIVAREAVKNGHNKIATEIFVARRAEYVHQICLQGDVDRIDKIIKNNDKLFEIKDRKGKLAIDYLIVVMREGINDELIDMFIKLLRKLNKEDRDKLLIEELDNEKLNKDIFKLLIKIGADVNAVMQGGRTALMEASQKGHREACKLLISKGADVNAKNVNGKTALMFASQSGHKEVCELLIEMEADVNAKNSSGWTALMIASDKSNREICELLMLKGAKYNTVLYEAINARDVKSIKKMWNKQSSELKLSKQDKIEASCLVAKLGYEDVFHVLGEERNELVVAREAIKNGHKKIATEIFIARRAEYAHQICLQGDVDKIDKIIKINDKLCRIKDKKGKLAINYLMVVMREGINDSLINMFIKLLRKISKEDIDKLLIEELDNEKINKDMFNLLIGSGIDVNATTKNGCTALMIAIEKGHIKVCELLISRGANVNAKNVNGKTALMFASQSGYKEMCELLIEMGAYVNLQNEYGWTALMIASQDGHREVCKLLIEMGADVNATLKGGTTALMIASEKGHEEVCELLRSKGAKGECIIL